MITRTRWPAVTAVIALIAFVLLDIALVGSARQAHAQDDEVVDADMALASVEAVLSGEEDDVVEAVLEIDSGPQGRSDLRLVTTVHTRVDDPAEMDAALLGDTRGVYSSVSTQLDDLASGKLCRVQNECDEAFRWDRNMRSAAGSAASRLSSRESASDSGAA